MRILSFFKHNLIRTTKILLIFASSNLFSQQYNVVGSAIAEGPNGCFTLTNNISQSGAVWNNNTINLLEPIDVTLVLNFGNISNDNLSSTCGGDGMSFILQPIGNGVGSVGSGSGFLGITPSFGVLMDTYPNGDVGDPFWDHISIHKNGDIEHGYSNELASYHIGHNNGFPEELEDGLNHTFRFVWEPNQSGGGGVASVYFDGIYVIGYTGDIVNEIFGGNPIVYWGVSASSGACWNKQTACMTLVAAFETNGVFCSGKEVSFTDITISSIGDVTSWQWNFGDGAVSDEQNPIHIFDGPGEYPVTLTVTAGGVVSTISQTVIIMDPLVSIAEVEPICKGSSITLDGTVSALPPYNFETLSFSNGIKYPIPDGGVSQNWTGSGENYASSDITVSGISGVWEVESVCINIDHTYVGDLIIYLKDPCGNLVLLVKDIQSSKGLKNTCFSPSATTSISNGTAPYTGSWIPVGGAGIWNTLTSCSNPNGQWSLVAGDYYSAYLGSISNWYITFKSNIEVNQIDYNWGQLNLPANTLNPQITPDTSMWVYLYAYDTNGCYNSDSVYIKVEEIPVVSAVGDTICSGETAVISASGASTYSWDNGMNGAIINVSPTTTQEYIVTGYNSICTDTAKAIVLVNPSVNVSVNNVTICEGETATLDPMGADFYTWDTGADDDPYIVQPNVTTTYTVVGYNNYDCKDTAEVVVTVNPLPNIILTAPSICENEQATITASGANEYSWSTGFAGNPLVISPAQTTIYTVTGTSLGCSSSAEIELVVNPLPIVDFSPSAISGCTPLLINFENNSQGNIVNWDWQVQGNTVGIDENLEYEFVSSGIYPVVLTVTTDSGCVSKSNPVDIDVYDVYATIYAEGSFTAGETVYFNDVGSGASSWVWSFGNELTSTNQTNVIPYEEAGEYWVFLFVQSKDGCTDKDSILLKINPVFTAYTPNAFTPNGDGLNDVWLPMGENWVAEEYELRIFDRWGKEMFYTNDINEGWKGPSENPKNNRQSVYSYRLKVKDTFGLKHEYFGEIFIIN